MALKRVRVVNAAHVFFDRMIDASVAKSSARETVVSGPFVGADNRSGLYVVGDDRL